MQKITMQDVINQCDAQTGGSISKELVNDKGPTPYVLMASAATAMVELLIERGVITGQQAKDAWHATSAIPLMEAARMSEDADNAGKYTVSLDQMLHDIFSKFPHMMLMRQKVDDKNLKLLVAALYAVTVGHLSDSGYLRHSIKPAVMAQGSRFTQESCALVGPLKPEEMEQLRKMYRPG